MCFLRHPNGWLVVIAHVLRDFRTQFRDGVRRAAQRLQPALPEIEPESIFLPIEFFVVSLDLGRVGEVIMLPDGSAAAVFICDRQSQADGIIRKNLPTSGEVMFQRTIEVKED